MVVAVVLSIAALISCSTAVMILTGLGSRRRGAGPAVATLSGLCFPIAWVVWYVRDERPFRRVHA